MKAIKVVEPFKIEILDVSNPVITDPEDVIIKVTSGGICGSDIGIWNGTNSLATYPRIIGHEFGGVVKEIGSGVKDISVGDLVAVDPVTSCGHCYACSIGRHNVCKDVKVIGVHKDGGFSEYVKVPADNVHKFSKDIDKSLLGMVEPFTIGVEINNRGMITKEDTLLIMGCGPIGLCTLQVAKMRGAKVVMTDKVKSRLLKAKELGADEVINVEEKDLETFVKAYTKEEGFSVIVDTVCIPATFEQSVQLASQAGRVVVIGLKDTPSNISMADITKKELTIVGSRLNCNCFDEVIKGFENKSLSPEKIKSATYNYRDIEKAFLTIKENPEDVIKIVIEFD